MNALRAVRRLFAERGAGAYHGEPVTQLEHALQAAYLGRAHSDDPIFVVAALLHDVGHLLEATDATPWGDVRHDRTGAAWLECVGFHPRVSRLVAGHVDAKRYLCAADADYLHGLSEASTRTLALQGGPMGGDEMRRFEDDELFDDILALRHLDDLAKTPGRAVPGLDAYDHDVLVAAGRPGPPPEFGFACSSIRPFVALEAC